MDLEKKTEMEKYLVELKKYIREKGVTLTRAGMGAFAYFETEAAIKQLIMDALDDGRNDYPRPPESIWATVFGDQTLEQFEEKTKASREVRRGRLIIPGLD